MIKRFVLYLVIDYTLFEFFKNEKFLNRLRNEMKDLKTMLPSELRQIEIELTAKIEKTVAAKTLKAVKKELTERKKDFWRPEVMRIVHATGKDSGKFVSKFGSPIGYKYSVREQIAKTVDVVSFDIIV